MANTFNDVMTKGRSYVRTAASPLDVTSGAACRIMSYTVTNGGADTTTILHDSTATDNAVYTLRTSAEVQTITGNFGPQGVLFSNGLSIEEAVAGHIAVIDYILE